METTRRCIHCKRAFVPNPRSKGQQYCGEPICQKARKAKWQRHKMNSDRDYRLNQKDAQCQWQQNNHTYWSKYRASHPEYCERNRRLQRTRDAKRRARRLAKMDALDQQKPVNPGTYYLIPLMPNLAKMDALTQRITLIPSSYKPQDRSCKKGLVGQMPLTEVDASKKEVRHDYQNPS